MLEYMINLCNVICMQATEKIASVVEIGIDELQACLLKIIIENLVKAVIN